MDIVAKNQSRLGNLPKPFPLSPAVRQKLFFGVLVTSDALMLTLAFWLAYVLTRPLGASIGDYTSQPVRAGGLGLGTTTTSFVFLAAIVALVAWFTVQQRSSDAARPSSPEPSPVTP